MMLMIDGAYDDDDSDAAAAAAAAAAADDDDEHFNSLMPSDAYMRQQAYNHWFR